MVRYALSFFLLTCACSQSGSTMSGGDGGNGADTVVILPSNCTTRIPCVNDTQCVSTPGTSCNTNSNLCQTVLCGEENTSCSRNEHCRNGLNCVSGACGSSSPPIAGCMNDCLGGRFTFSRRGVDASTILLEPFELTAGGSLTYNGATVNDFNMLCGHLCSFLTEERCATNRDTYHNIGLEGQSQTKEGNLYCVDFQINCKKDLQVTNVGPC